MARKRTGTAQLDAALLAVEQLDLEGLRRQWQALYGVPAPATFRTPLIRAGVAYKLQERALGGLRSATRSLLQRVADQADQHRRGGEGRGHAGEASDNFVSELSADMPPHPTSTPPADVDVAHPFGKSRQAPTRVKPGTRLLRSWQGRTHEVVVFEGGVVYRGKRYRSLSEVARLITGQRWSGPLFFGVKRRTGDKHKPEHKPVSSPSAPA